MILSVHDSPDAASEAAAAHLGDRLSQAGTENIMVAAGNTPLELYRRVAERHLDLPHLTVFALDEYVGVPLDEPRSCANLLRRAVVEAWRLSPRQFLAVSSLPEDALPSVQAHERKIDEAGGLDLIVLGLGKNGHLGFNEPGSAADSVGRVLPLESISVETNRQWFEGRYAPASGVTVGLKTILSSREILLLAFGAHKTDAAREMIEGPISDRCPASFLQRHPSVRVFLDDAAAAGLAERG